MKNDQESVQRLEGVRARFAAVRQRTVVVATVLLAATGLVAILLVTTSAGASSAPAFQLGSKSIGVANHRSVRSTGDPGTPDPALGVAQEDGLGITPGKIKHVWLIILENKSYDASFTGLNNNTYLWQTLPSQGVLLKNYYGTGHFSLDNYISLVSGQATQPDTQSDCPYYDTFSGSVDTSGTLATNPNYGQVDSAAGPERGRRLERMCLPGERADALQPTRRRGSELEGLRTGPGQSRRDSDGSDWRPDPRRGYVRLWCPVRKPRDDRKHDPGEPRKRERNRPVRAQALPVPLVRVDLAVRRLQLEPYRKPLRPRQWAVPRPAERGDNPCVQLDLAQ